MAEDDDQRFGPQAVLTPVPAVVWAVTLLHVMLLLAYSVLLPIYRAPDEPLHVDLVLAVRDDPFSWPDPGERQVAERVHHSISWLKGRSWLVEARDDPLRLEVPEPHLRSPGEATLRPARPSFRQLGGRRQMVWSNQLVQHPPTYYLLAAGWLSLAPGSEDWPFDRVVAFLRLLSVMLIAPLPLFAHAVARRLQGPGPVPVTASALMLAVPGFTHIGSVVNNDNLLTLVVALLTVVLTYVATGDRSRRTGAWVGGLLALALLTKGLALVLPPWIVLAYLLAWWRTRGQPPWSPLLVAGGFAAVAGGWWWVRNLVAYSRLQPHGTGVPLYPDKPGFVADPAAFWSDEWLRWVPERWWGSFGWLELPLSRGWVIGATAVLALGVALAILSRPVRRGARVEIALLLLPTVLLLVAVTAYVWDEYVRSSIGGGLQGRYLYPGLPGLMVVVALGYGRLFDRFRGRRGSAVLPAAVLLASAALHIKAVVQISRAWWGTADGAVEQRLAAILVWSPWPDEIMLGLAAAVVLAALVTLTLASVNATGITRGRLGSR